MILQILIQGLLKPWRNPSEDTKSGIWCLNDLHVHWYSVGTFGIIELFKGDFYFIAWGKMNVWCNILKFIFLKCQILVLEEGLLFQNLTHVMHFVVKHDSFLDGKPFHWQIHMGRKFCFPGYRDSRQKHQQTEPRALRELFLLGTLVNTQLSKLFTVTEIRHSTKYIQNTFSWGLYLAHQPGTMIRTWFHAHVQNQKCVPFPAVISCLSSPGPTSNVSPGIWRFWVNHNCHGITDS